MEIDKSLSPEPEIPKRRAEDRGEIPGFNLQKAKLEAATRISMALGSLIDNLSSEEKQALFTALKDTLKDISATEIKILNIILEIGRKLRKEDSMDFKMDVLKLICRILEIMTKKPLFIGEGEIRIKEVEPRIEPERRDSEKDVPAEVKGAVNRLKLEGPEAPVRQTDTNEFTNLVRDLAAVVAEESVKAAE